MNYYYDLPTDIIELIQSFLLIKTDDIVKIDNSRNCKIVLTDLINETIDPTRKKKLTNIMMLLYKYDLKYVRYYGLNAIGNEKKLIKYKEQLNQKNINHIKFLFMYDIKQSKELCKTKALKYGIPYNINEINTAKHINQFYTYDKKNVIISSTDYIDANNYHSKYGFKKYSYWLYHKDCATFILVI